MSAALNPADVTIVGAGPAGLTAALDLARAGIAVTIIDEQPELGGQYYHQRSPQIRDRLGEHRPEGRRLIESVRNAGVTCLTSTTVWGAHERHLSILTADSAVRELASRAVIVATGATEREIPFKGWQLPGVMSAGMAQHLTASEDVTIGRRVVVAGSGPFLIPAAAELARHGMTVVAVIEAGRPYCARLRAMPSILFPSRLVQIAGCFATLAAQGTTIRQTAAVINAAAGPDGRLARVDVAQMSDLTKVWRSYEVDALCISYGFRPQTELLRLLGCAVHEEESTHELVPITDGAGRTDIDGVYAAGESSGIRGVHSALAQGHLVAASVLEDLGEVRPSGRIDKARKAVAHEDRFAQLAGKLYPHPADLARTLLRAMPASTQVCRCEGVDLGTLRALAQVDELDLSAVKTRTRACMGPCQGRECSFAVAALFDSGLSSLTARAPVRPVPLSAIAGGQR